ncbi:MAG: PAS domain S-box protein [Chloroflexi bacterium]|nr:PAS domain S-box protein [Chloroflexota bacterium]
MTKQTQVDQAFRGTENLFLSILETASDAIISINDQGRIIFWNDSAEVLFGYSAEEIVKLPFLVPSESGHI